MCRCAMIVLAIVFVCLNAYAQEYVPNEILVSFGDKTRDAFGLVGGRVTCVYSSVSTLLEEYGMESAAKLTHSSAGAKNIYLIKFGGSVDIFTIIHELEQNEEIKSASPNYKLELLTTPNDYYYNNNWFMPGSSAWNDQWYLPVPPRNSILAEIGHSPGEVEL